MRLAFLKVYKIMQIEVDILWRIINQECVPDSETSERVKIKGET